MSCRIVFSLACSLSMALVSPNAFALNPVDTTDVQNFLETLPGLKHLASSGGNQFTFDYEQPVDHNNPTGPTFPMRAILLYKDATAPMVMNASGYQLMSSAYACELTSMLSANQLTLEHRYFGQSVPKPLDWQCLNITQSAGDFHRITQAFKGFFKGKWLNTGASKGGMTMIYHRYFYPEDVDCTVAYVAPNSYSRADERFIPFIEKLGTPGTSKKLEAWQQQALSRKAEIVAIMKERARQKGLTFDYTGGVEMAFEWALVQTPFFVWQYGNQASADAVPQGNVSAKKHMAYMDKVIRGDAVSFIASLTKSYKPYYFQAATELGEAAFKESHLPTLKYPHTCRPENYPPLNVEKHFDGQIMKKIQQWVDQEAEKIIFIYGGADPWSAAAFDVCPEAEKRGVKKYILPKGNHTTQIRNLPQSEFKDCKKHITDFMEREISLQYDAHFRASEEDIFVMQKHNIR